MQLVGCCTAGVLPEVVGADSVWPAGMCVCLAKIGLRLGGVKGGSDVVQPSSCCCLLIPLSCAISWHRQTHITPQHE